MVFVLINQGTKIAGIILVKKEWKTNVMPGSYDEPPSGEPPAVIFSSPVGTIDGFIVPSNEIGEFVAETPTALPHWIKRAIVAEQMNAEYLLWMQRRGFMREPQKVLKRTKEELKKRGIEIERT